MRTLDQLEEWDELSELKCAFTAADDFEDTANPGVAIPRFGTEKIHGVQGFEPGENDESDLIAYGNFCSGGWWCIEAWRDYTGWGCQDGGSVRIAKTELGIIGKGLSTEARKRLGLEDVVTSL